jgi:hypothetical protein
MCSSRVGRKFFCYALGHYWRRDQLRTAIFDEFVSCPSRTTLDSSLQGSLVLCFLPQFVVKLHERNGTAMLPEAQKHPLHADEGLGIGRFVHCFQVAQCRLPGICGHYLKKVYGGIEGRG